MAAQLIYSLATTDELAELFSDESVLQAMLDFEVALAGAEAGVGILPQAAAEKIAAAAKAHLFDAAAMSHDALRAGTLGIPLVKALTERVRASDPAAAGFVHWGATSQDVADTALVLLLKRAKSIFERDLACLEKALQSLAEKHANTTMLGRTLMQSAPPITFGLKVAGWLGSIQRSHHGLNASFSDALIVQFGGASGTLASLGDQGIVVGQALAHELGLAYPDAPWHTHRDRLAMLLCDCGVLTGCLAKMARDISLLMQNEIGEVAEPSESGRGGSSTMPHKHNPIGCSLTLAAAYRVPGLVASFLSGMTQEHERGTGGSQAEWPTVAALIQSTGLAIASMMEVAEGLSVNSAKMRSNIEAASGTIFAEKAMMVLGQKLGRDAAHKLLEEATRKSIAESRRLSEVLADMPEIAARIDAETLRNLEDPGKYLGVADEFRKRLLSMPKAGNSKREASKSEGK
jgi:3-carboxy-cis,cis-muconate cycloisomerase